MKLLEAEQPRELVELKLTKSQKATRKYNDLGERGATTDHGHHHGPSVVATASVFSDSYLSFKGIVIGGVRGES